MSRHVVLTYGATRGTDLAPGTILLLAGECLRVVGRCKGRRKILVRRSA